MTSLVLRHVAAPPVHATLTRSAIYLPPDLEGYAERGGGVAGLAWAALWIAFAGTVVYVERHQLFPSRER